MKLNLKIIFNLYLYKVWELCPFCQTINGLIDSLKTKYIWLWDKRLISWNQIFIIIKMHSILHLDALPNDSKWIEKSCFVADNYFKEQKRLTLIQTKDHLSYITNCLKRGRISNVINSKWLLASYLIYNVPKIVKTKTVKLNLVKPNLFNIRVAIELTIGAFIESG